MKIQKTLLKEIADNTDNKKGFFYIVSGNDAWVLTRFSSPLQMKIQKNCEMALVNVQTNYYIPIIHAVILFAVNPPSRINWFLIALRIGSNGIDEINDEIH